MGRIDCTIVYYDGYYSIIVGASLTKLPSAAPRLNIICYGSNVKPKLREWVKWRYILKTRTIERVNNNTFEGWIYTANKWFSAEFAHRTKFSRQLRLSFIVPENNCFQEL